LSIDILPICAELRRGRERERTKKGKDKRGRKDEGKTGREGDEGDYSFVVVWSVQWRTHQIDK